MSLPYVIRAQARTEIDAAYEWYEAQQQGRGLRFLYEVRDRIAEISQNPLLYGSVSRVIRAAPLRRFRYVVYYRVLPDHVAIIAVQHGHADPRRWKRRR